MSKTSNKTPVDNEGKEITITPGPRWVMDQSIPFWPKMIIQRLTKNQQMRGGYHMGRRGEKNRCRSRWPHFPTEEQIYWNPENCVMHQDVEVATRCSDVVAGPQKEIDMP